MCSVVCFLPCLHNPRSLPSVALTWFSRHRGTSPEFSPSPRNRALSPSPLPSFILSPHALGVSLEICLAFNLLRLVVLRVIWEETPALVVIYHSCTFSFPFSCHPLWLNLSIFVFSFPSVPVLHLYLHLYQHTKTNYNSTWTTAASHQFPYKHNQQKEDRSGEGGGSGSGGRKRVTR